MPDNDSDSPKYEPVPLKIRGEYLGRLKDLGGSYMSLLLESGESNGTKVLVPTIHLVVKSEDEADLLEGHFELNNVIFHIADLALEMKRSLQVLSQFAEGPTKLHPVFLRRARDELAKCQRHIEAAQQAIVGDAIAANLASKSD